SAPRVRDFLGPIFVVESFGADSGAQSGQSLLYTGYTYKGAKLDQWGRGFLGFYEVKATNLNTQIETINRHRQDFPFTGMVMESIQKIPDRVIDTFPDTDIVQCPGAIKPLTPSALPDGCKI